MTSAPKISVITPSFNQAAFVEETIRSVLDQNYPNLEYIVIDGGSTDGSVEIIRRYEARLAYFVSEPDKGHGHALNKGFRRATGEIMCWLNSDDKYLPWSFATVAEIFSQFPDINWISGTPAFCNDKGAVLAALPKFKNVFDLLDGNYKWIQQESVFWRQGLWQKAGAYIDENYKFMVDGELWTRFFALDNLWHANALLSAYRLHGRNRAVKNAQACVDEMELAIKAMRARLNEPQLARMNKDYFSLIYDADTSRWKQGLLQRQPRL